MKIYNVSQGSNEWHNLRKGQAPESKYFTPFRFTASQIYCLSGLSAFKSRETYIMESLNIIDRDIITNEHMQRGNRLEPKIRQMYETKMNTEVTEVGFVIPEWCPFIGVSPDGLVSSDGCIEIKAPVKQYKHPKPEHYAQMQMTMKVCERSWCDYVVYSESDDTLNIKRIHMDDFYWDNTLYTQIKEAISESLYILNEICIADIEHD